MPIFDYKLKLFQVNVKRSSLGHFRWPDFSPIDPRLLGNLNEIQNTDKTESCFEMHASSLFLLWQDCQKENYFICEYNLS